MFERCFGRYSMGENGDAKGKGNNIWIQQGWHFQEKSEGVLTF